MSLAPVLRGKSTGLEPRTLFFRYQNPGGPVQRAAVREGWKYLRDQAEQEHLFHLDNDRSEKTDLREQEAERFQELKGAWEAWEPKVRSGAPQLPPRS